jgi:hypothetical protein
LQDHQHAVADVDQEKDVQGEPGELRREAADVKFAEVGNCGGAADRGQRSFIAIVERQRLVAATRIAGVGGLIKYGAPSDIRPRPVSRSANSKARSSRRAMRSSRCGRTSNSNNRRVGCAERT